MTHAPHPAGDATTRDGVTRADLGADEVQTTSAERLLALVLAVFVLIGLLWAYSQPLDRTDDGGDRYAVGQQYEKPLPGVGTGGEGGLSDLSRLTPDEAVLTRYEQAVGTEQQAGFALDAAQQDEVRARETYRTELDAGRPATSLEQAYRTAQATTVRAQESLATATAAREELEPGYRQVQGRLDDQARTDRLVTFLLRLVWVVGVLAGGLFWLGRLRGRRSRWQPLGAAVVGAATVQALVMAGDYLGITDLSALGPLVLSLLGAGVTVAAFVAYQRWLARRLAPRRVRKGECPYCGHPAVDGSHCVGCGRSVLAPCVACAAPRRVGSRFCATCGASGAEPAPVDPVEVRV